MKNRTNRHRIMACALAFAAVMLGPQAARSQPQAAPSASASASQANTFAQNCARIYDAAACRCAALTVAADDGRQAARPSRDADAAPFADPMLRAAAVRQVQACMNPHTAGD